MSEVMIKQVITNLIETRELLNNLNTAQYSRKLEILTNVSIGEHVRHILEFYQCLFKGLESKTVNYDSRQRDARLATDLGFASTAINNIITNLRKIKSDFTLTFVANYSTSIDERYELLNSSFYRELAYNLEHSIHHQALIKVAITEMKLTGLVKSTFGYAPSTLKYIKICAQ